MKSVAITINADLSAINGANHIYPPTFGATEHSARGFKHNLVGLDIKTGAAEAVQVDSVGSFANRIEASLLSSNILPEIKTIVGDKEISVNELPHRVYDAVLRDSNLNGVAWRESKIGKMILESKAQDATALFKYAPLVLLFGGWDSMGGDAVKGVKIARSVACEIWGYNVQSVMHSAHRINPFPSASESGAFALEDGKFKVLESDEDIKKAKKDKTLKRLSECGHGSVFDGVQKGCFVEDIKFTGSISLTRLNRYQFPGEGDLEARNKAARKVLTNLALFGIMITLDQLDLRSGCELYTTTRQIQKIYSDGQREDLDVTRIQDGLHNSIAEAKSAGLEFAKEPIILEAGKDLVKLAGVL
ncbi:MAG: type I-U CRISPR-associated protein Cas7 [Desulfobacteraceae bacterium]|nr:type I-U CRISPR-associated protein Cas7 [Desulfobacteraceae bacterium]